jgi:hypothetical protein
MRILALAIPVIATIAAAAPARAQTYAPPIRSACRYGARSTITIAASRRCHNATFRPQPAPRNAWSILTSPAPSRLDRSTVATAITTDLLTTAFLSVL